MTLGNKGVGKVLCLRLQRQLLLVVVTLFLLFTAAREFKKPIKLQSLKITRKTKKTAKERETFIGVTLETGRKQIHFRVKLEKLV